MIGDMKTGIPLIAIALASSLPPAAALGGVEILETEGHLRQEVYYAPTPVPDWCYWDRGPSPASFHAVNADGNGSSGCQIPWLVHCDADSLAFAGHWPANDAVYVHSSLYEITLECRVRLDTDMKLHANRTVDSGELLFDQHTLTVDLPDGGTVAVLGDSTMIDTAELLLPPGEYDLRLYVYAMQLSYGGEIDPYDGQVRMWWSEFEPVETVPTSWGRIKALYTGR